MRYKHPIFRHQEEGESIGVNIAPLSLFVIGVLALLAGYIGWLQLYKSREMDAWARRQQDSIAIIPGRRGNLLDRNGVELNKSSCATRATLSAGRWTRSAQPSPTLLPSWDLISTTAAPRARRHESTSSGTPPCPSSSGRTSIR